MNGSIPICRVCLKTSLEYIDLETPFDMTNKQEDMQDYTSTPECDFVDEKSPKELTYLDCFKECTRLDMAKCDNCPQSLCSACGLELRIAYEFIKKAISSAEILEAAAAKTKLERSISPSRDEPILVRDELSKFSEYEEIVGEPEPSSDLDIENDEKLDINTNTDEDEFLLNTHTTAEHCDIIDGFMKYETKGQDENDDSASIIEVDIVHNEESSYGNFEKTEDFEMEEVQMDENNIQSNHDIDANCAANDNNDEERANAAKIKKRKTKMTFRQKAEQIREETILNCADCEEHFSTKDSLHLHHRNKHRMTSNSTNLCEICNKNLCIDDEIQNVHKCSDCEGQEKKTKEEYEHEHNDQEQNKNFLCNICSKTFPTHGILNAHLKYHQRKQANIKSDACSICGKQFSTKHYLRMHMQVHTNDRELHKCSQCDKLYVTKTALDNHMKLHNGETIKCVSCHKEFSRQYELNVHMRFHTRDYPFECEICGKKFAIKGHLRTHMWRHQGLKLQCEDCGKLFTSSKALLEHSFTHSVMPFPCSYCPKGYPSKQKFKVHLKTAHSVELNEEELQKVVRKIVHKPLLRKKLTLVQADSVMKEVEVKTKDDDTEDVQDFVITFF